MSARFSYILLFFTLVACAQQSKPHFVLSGDDPSVSISLSPDSCQASVLLDEATLPREGDRAGTYTVTLPFAVEGGKSDVKVDARGPHVGELQASLKIVWGAKTATFHSGVPASEVDWIETQMFDDVNPVESPQVTLTMDGSEPTDDFLFGVDSLEFVLSGCAQS